MALCAGPTLSSSSSSSSLNPNAPFFVPAAFLAAEDFSPEWWRLVQTCPAFRDFWLAERYDPDLQLAQEFFDDVALEVDNDEAFLPDLYMHSADLKEEENLPPTSGLDLHNFARKAGLDELSISPRQNRRSAFYPLPYQEKPLKVVMAARQQKPVALRKTIQQPR